MSVFPFRYPLGSYIARRHGFNASSRSEIAGLGAPRGGGAGSAQTRSVANPQQAFGLPGRSQPHPTEPCGSGRPEERGLTRLGAPSTHAAGRFGELRGLVKCETPRPSRADRPPAPATVLVSASQGLGDRLYTPLSRCVSDEVCPDKRVYGRD